MNVTLGQAASAVVPSGAIVTATTFVTAMWATVGTSNVAIICGASVVGLAIVCASAEKIAALFAAGKPAEDPQNIAGHG